MRRADGTPWIHSFAHGRTIYDAQARRQRVRKAMEQAAKEEVVATFALLAAGADLDAIELAELRQLAKKLSGDRPARHRWRAQSGAAEAGRAERSRPRALSVPRAGRTRGHG